MCVFVRVRVRAYLCNTYVIIIVYICNMIGGQNEIVNFRRNPVDSPWVGELHQVLLSQGVLHKMKSGSLLLSASLQSSPYTSSVVRAATLCLRRVAMGGRMEGGGR